MLSRRTLLGVGLALAARRAVAFGDAARLSFAQVRHRGRWDPRPDGLARLAWEISKRTSIETSPAVKSIALADPELFRYPFAVLSSDQAVPPPADNEVAELRRYLSYGGFLLLDDASATRGGGFEQSARQIVSRIVPGAFPATTCSTSRSTCSTVRRAASLPARTWKRSSWADAWRSCTPGTTSSARCPETRSAPGSSR